MIEIYVIAINQGVSLPFFFFFFVKLFVEKNILNYMQLNVTPQAFFKKKKKKRSDFYGDPREPTYPIISSPLISLKLSHYLILLGQPALLTLFFLLLFFFFFFSQHNTNSPLFTPLLSRQYHSSPLPPPFFSKITLKIHRKKVRLTHLYYLR